MITFDTDAQLRLAPALNANLQLSAPIAATELPAIGAQSRHE